MKTLVIGLILIVAGVVSRIIPHPPNFAPIVAIALVGGIYLDRRLALLVPLLAMIVSDAVIGFHGLVFFVYGSFACAGLVGIWLRQHKRTVPIVAGTLTSSIIFFVVTNFGVWIMGNGAFYPMSPGGLLACYAAGIPFFRNGLLGDVVYTGLLIGTFELVEHVMRHRSISRANP